MFREGHCRHLQAAPSPRMSVVGAVLMLPCGTSSVLILQLRPGTLERVKVMSSLSADCYMCVLWRSKHCR